MSKELKVTSIQELSKIAKGEIIELPPFTGDVPFVARLKRPSMLALAKSGRIPNTLLEKANDLFSGGVPNVAHKYNSDPKMMADLMSVLDIICEDSFMEPTFQELKDNGIELTDAQYLAVFAYVQRGVKSLENFRK